MVNENALNSGRSLIRDIPKDYNPLRERDIRFNRK